MRTVSAMVLLLGSIATWVGCGGKDLGESCDKEGSTDPCNDGLVCGKETDGTLRCQKQCTSQADCPTGQECNGMTGSLKGCRVKK